MRDIINLIEDQTPTSGMLPAQDLAKLLPDIDNLETFTSALQKVEDGQENNLSVLEKSELANAFISLIKAEDVKKTQIVQKMMPVVQNQPKPAQNQQPQKL